ncbi:MAG: AMP-binding protein, partial [Burkholderiaceae bacterium]|nr:AMP-binding protein [Burkholderiaceae bacterium]
MKVEIWSDVVCPWCFIGKRRFDKAIATLRERGVTTPIEVVYRSYQLDPGAPVGDPVPAVDGYAKKFGGRERAEQIIGHVTRVAAQLKSFGVGPGDRVVAFMPNIPETLIAFLATASLGAVWSSCSTDFGVRSVLDRFQQIAPRVMFCVDGYRYGGKDFDRRPEA